MPERPGHRRQVDPAGFDAGRMDTQGAEMQVLRDAARILDRRTRIEAEPFRLDAPKGVCRRPEVDTFLAKRGSDRSRSASWHGTRRAAWPRT